MNQNIYEIQSISINSKLDREIWASKPLSEAKSFSDIVFGTEINKSFFAFKLHKIWGFLDFLCNNFFHVITLVIFTLTIYWQISISMLINLIVLAIYYIGVSFKLQP